MKIIKERKKPEKLKPAIVISIPTCKIITCDNCSTTFRLKQKDIKCENIIRFCYFNCPACKQLYIPERE